MKIIKTKNLTKNFDDVQALKELSLEVESGQILGLLGPNGAGKTTLIKALVGGVRPSGGSVEVFGLNPLKNKKKLAGRFGYMPQAACLYEDLSVVENIHFFAKLHLKKVPVEKVNQLLKLLGMESKSNQRVTHLSGGMKTRVSLACALVHEPDILFLDEPTAGLDPALKRTLWDMFRQLSDAGKTLFISTHLMDEALLCDQLALIREGQLLTKDTPQRIVAHGQASVKLRQKNGQETKKYLPADPEAIAAFLRKYGLSEDIEAVDIDKESLEDVTIRIVEGEYV